MWELDCEEGWAPKNWCFWTVVLEKTLESPLDCKEFQPVHSEGDRPWVFFGRNDAKAETPVLWPPHVKRWLLGKDSDAGRDWGQEEKGTTEDEMAGWHHRLDGHEFEWTLGVGDGQGGLACCNSWGRKELDMIERLNWTELSLTLQGASLVAQTVKNPPAMQETWVQFLCCEDPLEKGMATHSNVLTWGVPETGCWQVAVCGLQRVGHDWGTNIFTSRCSWSALSPSAVQHWPSAY